MDKLDKSEERIFLIDELKEAINPKNNKVLRYLGQCDEKEDFTFQSKKSGDEIIKQKYSSLYYDLKEMQNEDIIQLLLQEIQQNQEYKLSIESLSSQMKSLTQELRSSRESLKKKCTTISLLCETQSRNLQLIQKLQVKLSKRSERNKDTYYEKKYQQLSLYMNQYIRNINEAQEEFKRVYNYLKNENKRLENQLSISNIQSIKNSKKNQFQNQQIKRLNNQIEQLLLKDKICEQNIALVKEENQVLRKEVQVYQENLRITDRLEVHLCAENQHLSSQLDFIRDKISENHNISKDIIERLEESSLNCQKASKAKDQLSQSLIKQRQKCQQLQKQIGIMRKKNIQLEGQLDRLKQDYDKILDRKQQLQSDNLQQKVEKQSIKKQLLLLADKVQFMESTYKKQIEQSQKIKGQLCKFWQNKQKNQSLMSHQLGSREDPNHILSQIQVAESSVQSQSQSQSIYLQNQKNQNPSRLLATQNSKVSRSSFRKVSLDRTMLGSRNNKENQQSFIETSK